MRFRLGRGRPVGWAGMSEIGIGKGTDETGGEMTIGIRTGTGTGTTAIGIETDRGIVRIGIETELRDGATDDGQDLGLSPDHAPRGEIVVTSMVTVGSGLLQVSAIDMEVTRGDG